MNEFFGWSMAQGQATFQTNINGKCVSLCGDNNCSKDIELRRFSLAVFNDLGHRDFITSQVITDKDQWIDEDGKEVVGTVENFIAAIEWCKAH